MDDYKIIIAKTGTCHLFHYVILKMQNKSQFILHFARFALSLHSSTANGRKRPDYGMCP